MTERAQSMDAEEREWQAHTLAKYQFGEDGDA